MVMQTRTWAPQHRQKISTRLLFSSARAWRPLGGSALPWGKTAPLGAQPQPLVLEVELAASTKNGPAYRLLVCGRPGRGDEEVKNELMPDRLHPNAQGQRLMAHCIGDALRKLDRRKVPDATRKG